MRLRKLVMASVVLIVLSGCEKDAEIQPKAYPYVIIDEIEMKTNEYVTIHAQLFYSGNPDIVDHGFIIHDMALNKEFELSIMESMGPMEKSQTHFNYTMRKGLVRGMEFSVRAFTETPDHTVYSNEKTFRSPVGIN